MTSIEAVIDAHGDYLLRVAYVYVKNQASAEDIVQEVFIAYYEKQAQFRHEASLRTYLVRITVNRCHDYVRSWRYKRIVLFDKVTGRQSYETPEKIYMDQVVQTDLLTTVLTLSLPYREVIMLYYYQELSTVEIAGLLGCPESTIRSRLQRARRQLKKQLQADERKELSHE